MFYITKIKDEIKQQILKQKGDKNSFFNAYFFNKISYCNYNQSIVKNFR